MESKKDKSSKFEADKKNQNGNAGWHLTTIQDLEFKDIDKLKLEYFFHTQSKVKADKLNKILADEYGYNTYPVQINEKVFFVSGWTKQATFKTTFIQDWTQQMRNLALKHDCEYDGWSTKRDQ